MAHALIGQRPGGQLVAVQKVASQGPAATRDRVAGADEVTGAIVPPPRRLWQDTPLVAVQAATARSYGRSVLCALGITPDGRKRVLGYRWDATSMQVSAGAFVEDLFTRGVRAPAGSRLLFVTDGEPALDQAIAHRYPGAYHALCHRAFAERVLAYLAKSAVEGEVREALRRALRRGPEEMRQDLDRLAQSLVVSHPGAAGAMREGLKGVMAVPSLCVDPVLSTSLCSVATLRTAVAEAVRAGRGHGVDGIGKEDPLWAGSEAFERRTRRILGYEALRHLEHTLSRPERVA